MRALICQLGGDEQVLFTSERPASFGRLNHYSVKLHKPARKIASELITLTVSPGVVNLHSKHDLICHTARVKAVTSLYPWLFLAWLLLGYQ